MSGLRNFRFNTNGQDKKIQEDVSKGEIMEGIEEFTSPRQQWYREVYLVSEYWKNKKQKMLNYYNNKCCLCGSTENLNIHHLHYNIDENTPINEWENKGEGERSLVVLCKDCHQHIHNVKKIEDFKIVNLWSKYSKIIESKKYSIEQVIFMYWQEVNEIIVESMEMFFEGRRTKHLMRLSSYFNDSRKFFDIYSSLERKFLQPIYAKVRNEMLPKYTQLYSQRTKKRRENERHNISRI